MYGFCVVVQVKYTACPADSAGFYVKNFNIHKKYLLFWKHLISYNYNYVLTK